MYRATSIEEDLLLKQVIDDRFSLSSDERGYLWREVLPKDKRIPIPDIIVTRGTTDSHFSLEDVADAIGDSLADLLISRSHDETSIFSDVNRRFVAEVAHAVAGCLTKSLDEGGRLRLSEGDLFLLIEKALLENEAYDVAKSLAFRRSIQSSKAVAPCGETKSFDDYVYDIKKEKEFYSSAVAPTARSRRREKRPIRPFRTAEPLTSWYKNTDIGFLAILEYGPDDSLDTCDDNDL